MLDDPNGIQVEKVAALAPDLIIGQYAGMTEKDYDLLSKIAPTVAQPGDYADYGAPWDEMALNIGKAVGKPEEMQALIDDVKAQIADAAAAHPAFAGKTALVVHAVRGPLRLRPRGPALADAGRARLRVPDGRLRRAEDEEFGSSLSSERTSDLDQVDVAVIARPRRRRGGEGASSRGTEAFDEGRYIDISEANGAYYVAHSFVTPLSIPYVLERYVPQLAAAVDADPATVPPVVTDGPHDSRARPLSGAGLCVS